nr:LRR1 protein [Portunus trituberculatus]
MKFRQLMWAAWAWWVFLTACAWAESGVGEGVECLCGLEPAYDNVPGGGEGNLLWNCRDLLLPEVPTACWAIHSNVTQVDLFNNHITTIRKGDFDALWNLHYINTFMGHLSTVEEGSLRGLTHLQHLDLGYSFLKEVPEEVSYLTQLQVLALEYNYITEVPVEVIKPLVNLQWLSLVRNHVQAIPELDFLPHLTWLDLEANELTALPATLFGDLLFPCKLWINDNPLSDVAARTLLPLPGGSEIRTNASVAIWARDDGENSQLLAREWHVYDKELNELDLNTMIHRCDQEPHDPDDTHPCHM